jgi:hypothetical protein
MTQFASRTPGSFHTRQQTRFGVYPYHGMQDSLPRALTPKNEARLESETTPGRVTPATPS